MAPGIVYFEFTSDDVIQYSTVPPYEKISFKAMYKDVDEDIGTNHYAFTLYNATTFRFDRNPDGKLSFMGMTLVKQ